MRASTRTRICASEKVDGNAQIIVSPLDKLEEPDSLKALRTEVRDRLPEAFLLRRLLASFPFSSIGAGVSAFLRVDALPDFLAAFAMPQIIAPADLSQ
jgi:hypothetical protein